MYSDWSDGNLEVTTVLWLLPLETPNRRYWRWALGLAPGAVEVAGFTNGDVTVDIYAVGPWCVKQERSETERSHVERNIEKPGGVVRWAPLDIIKQKMEYSM